MQEDSDNYLEEMSYPEAYVSDTTCPTCYAEFLDEEDLEIHIKQMHAVEPTKSCQICPVTHADNLEYAAHVRDVHLMDLRGCKYCAKVFTDGCKLKLHQKRHISNENRFYTCSQCNSIYKDIFSLQFHERNQHNNRTDGLFLECMQCLSSILCLNAVELVQSIGKKVFRCISCQFTSISLLAYVQHLKVSQCQCLVCDQCAEAYKERKNLLRHFAKTKKCVGNRFVDEMVTCNDCGKSIQPKAMIFHLKTCTALRCVDCYQSFLTIDDLSQHQTKEHPLGLDLSKCKYCLKEFIGQEALRKHIGRVHKPTFHLYKYLCKECDSIFQHPQKLFAHYFTQHKDIQPFHCKICDKKFRVRKGFSLHIKLDHKSVGFVEFDEQYRVYFTDKKSDKPFIPKCVIPDDELNGYGDDDFQDGIQLQDEDSDATDADTVEDKRPAKKKLPSKRGKTKKARKQNSVPVYSSDEEPLVAVRKRALKKKSFDQTWLWKKTNQFMCDVCGKNCYTFQNHQNHMNTHQEDQEIECVKCSKMFDNQRDLTRHIDKEHATSKLTETLKSLLQKKKQVENIDRSTPNINVIKIPDRFKVVMTKVDINKSDVAATITPVKGGISVRNFLENFTPETTESKQRKAEVNSSVSIKPYYNPFLRQSTIKLTKFSDNPIYERVPLRMPERFKDQNHVETKITIKMVQKTYKPAVEFILPDITEKTEDMEIDYTDSFLDHDYTDDREDIDIPDVAQEVSLEGTDVPQEAPKIVIPKMPEGYKKIHIATLQSEAPYYKIIKVDSDNLQVEDNNQPSTTTDTQVFDLGGTKLVTANPLAHLLGDSVDKILEPIKNKYYKPPKKDYQELLAKAMKKLKEAPPKKPRTRKKKESEASKDKEKD